MGLIVKFVLVVLVVVVVLWLMLGRRRGDGPARGRDQRKAEPKRAQEMLECAHCGLHLPSADAVMAGSRVYCSEAHRSLGVRPTDPT